MRELAPGWYPDPTDPSRRAYWDGKRWHDEDALSAAEIKRKAQEGKVKNVVYLVAFVIGAAFILHGCIQNASRSTSTSAPSSSASAPSSISSPTSTTYSTQEYQAAVIDTCEKAVKKRLKDPDSAKFADDWKAWQVTAGKIEAPPGMAFDPAGGDKLYSAGGSVNAKNGFGGYNGDEPYICDAVINPNGDIHARAHPMADDLTPTTDAPIPAN